MIGIVAGGILQLTSYLDMVQLFKQGFSQFFLIVLLPPILYESAINMEKNFGSIIFYAVVGTIVATFITAILIYWLALMGFQDMHFTECVAFGALISATDPVAVLSIFKELGVDQTLFILIFGESILNDAVAILLYDSAVAAQRDQQNFISTVFSFFLLFFGSMFIGLLIGIISAYVTKKFTPNNSVGRESDQQNKLERTILIVIPWVSYFVAQGLSMSGIVSIVFCGIIMARYTLRNVSKSSKQLNKQLYHALAYNCENIVFIFIGIGIVSFDLAWKQMGPWFFLLVFIIIQFARASNIYGLSYILNYYRQDNKISKTFQFFIYFAGLRGAMAFAISMKATTEFKENKIGEIMLAMTLLLAIINIFINATSFFALIIKFDIIQKPLPPKTENSEEIGNTSIWHSLRQNIVMFDENCLQKVLIRDSENLEEIGTSSNLDISINNDVNKQINIQLVDKQSQSTVSDQVVIIEKSREQQEQENQQQIDDYQNYNRSDSQPNNLGNYQ